MEGGAGCERGHVNRLGLWEYDAPRFHDFEQPSPSCGECSVDKWFDTSATKGLMSPVSGGGSPDGEDSDGQREEVQQGDVTSKARGGVTKGMRMEERKVLGNVTNTIKVVDAVVGFGHQKQHAKSVLDTRKVCKSAGKAPRTEGEVQSSQVEKQTSTKFDSAKRSVEGNTGGKHTALGIEGEHKVEKVHPKVSVQKKEEMPVLRKEDVVSKRKQDEAIHRPVTRSWTGKLTVPKSPMLLSRMRGTVHKKVIKSSEELEMEEIEKKKKEVAALRRKSQHPKKNGVEQPRQPQHKRKQVTVPREPNLRTSKRMRTVANAPREAAAPSGFTVGKPDMSTRQNRARNSRPVTRDASRPVTRSQSQKLTLPKTPNFATKSRVRAARFKTTEELELEEIEKNKFKAKPLNRKILEKKQNSKSVIKSKKPATVPQPFSFATEKRAASVNSRSVDKSYPKPFIFGEGPVTRKKAKIATTRSTKQVDVPLKSQPEKILAEPAVAARTDEGLVQPRIRHASRGSLLLGGAMRVIRRQNDDEQPESEEHAPAQQHCTADDGVHDFIKVCLLCVLVQWYLYYIVEFFCFCFAESRQ